MNGAAHGYAPDYITNLVTLTSATSGRSHLRSADSLTFDIPRMRMRIDDRALSVAGPRAWNTLPADIRCALGLDTFKKRLKSHLFSAAYETITTFFVLLTVYCCVFYVLLLFAQC